jgi:DNA-binding NarL/FixJ family response regulator
MINICVFEDHPIVVKSLHDLFLINKNYNLIFHSKTKDDFYKKIELNESIDVAIVDVISVDVRGLEVFEHLKKNNPEISVIAFTTLSSPVFVENLLTMGVKGYVNKNQEFEDLLDAVNVVSKNEIYLPPDYAFLKSLFPQRKNNVLTNREIEIIQLISKEFTTKDISQQLNISINTVENHRKSIFAKLEVKNVAGMILESVKMGYL